MSSVPGRAFTGKRAAFWQSCEFEIELRCSADMEADHGSLGENGSNGHFNSQLTVWELAFSSLPKLSRCFRFRGTLNYKSAQETGLT